MLPIIILLAFLDYQVLTGRTVQTIAGWQNKLVATKVLPSELPKSISTVIFGGDVMLSRVVGQQMAKQQDYTWPFKKIAASLAEADLTVVNLESPLAKTGPYLVKTGSFAFKADPLAVVGLKTAGIDVVSLANNHALNAGLDNLLFTKEFLQQQGIKALGAGVNKQQASLPVIIKVNDLVLGFLAYTYNSEPYLAELSSKTMAKEVEQLKKQVDQVVVIMHAGEEYSAQPTLEQQKFADRAIAAGAALVVGHHAHWPQKIKVVLDENGQTKGLIIYGLGNLVFDQMWSRETQRGVLAKISWQGQTLKSLEIIPVRILNYGQANLATSTMDIDWVLQSLGISKTKLEF